MTPRLAGAVLTVSLVLATSALADDSAKDLAKFTGTWTVLSVEAGGVKTSADELKQLNLRLIIKDKLYEAMAGEMKIDFGIIKVDASKKPRAIDVTPKVGVNADKGIPAIYEFKNDELHVCYDMSSTKRPTEFKTKEGTQETYIVYKKAK